MWFAWIWAFGFGLIPYLLLYLLPIKRMPGLISENIYNLGVALITVRSVFKGVIIIYNTTNKPMVTIYTILSIVALSLGAALYIVGLYINEKTKEK